MGIADSMKGITEDIITSYDLRVKALGNIVADTRKTLEGFASDRKKMGEEQAKNLADFIDGLSKSVEDMLKRFQREHKDMSETLSKSLSDFVNDLTKRVGNMMKNIQKAHKEMADNLRASLEKGETDRLKTYKDMMGSIQKDIKDIESYVANKLKEFSDAHTDMSEALKKDLAKYVGEVVSSVKKLLGEYNSDMKKAREAWNGLAATMEKKRGIMPEVEAEVKVRPVEEVIQEVEEVIEEERVEAEEVPSDVGLEEKVLEFINKHPEGVKVGDMEEPLGIARTRLGVIAKKLLDEGKVRKEGNLYFPL